MRDLSAIFTVVHHKHFQILDVVHHALIKAIRQNVPGLPVSSIADIWHDHTASLELSANTRVNTLGATPAFLQIATSQ